jgi:hypothetical protein
MKASTKVGAVVWSRTVAVGFAFVGVHKKARGEIGRGKPPYVRLRTSTKHLPSLPGKKRNCAPLPRVVRP